MTQAVQAPPAPASGFRVFGWLRYVAALVVFAVIVYAGIAYVWHFSAEEAARSWAILTAVALGLAFAAYAAVEYWQTGALTSISRQFDTRTVVLMPVAIALNIVLGQAVAAALKIPIYLDSIGTILVGALAGPIPGALTGLAANLIWTYVLPPPFHSDFAAAFAIVAAEIGLMAGVFARIGWMRPRPHSSGSTLIVGGMVAVGLVLLMAWYAYDRFFRPQGLDVSAGTTDLLFLGLALVIGLIAVAAIVGFVDPALRAPGRHGRVRGRGRHHDRHRQRPHQRPHRGEPVQRCDRRRHRLPGRGVPAEWIGYLHRHIPAGSPVRPRGQAGHVHDRLPHPHRHGPPNEGTLPAG